MNEEQAFLDDLRDHPEDDVTRLVYADWLEERGDPRGAYLRAEVALGRMAEGDEGYAEVEAELGRVHDGIDRGWVEQAGKRWDVVFLGQDLRYKIAAIKLIRALGPYGLAKVAEIVEYAPQILLLAAPRYEAAVARQHLLGSNPVAQVRVEIIPNGEASEKFLSNARRHDFTPVPWHPTILSPLPRFSDPTTS